LNAMVGAWWIFPADLFLAFSADIWAGRPSLMCVSGLSEGSSKGVLVRGSAAAAAGGPQKGMAQAGSERPMQRHGNATATALAGDADLSAGVSPPMVMRAAGSGNARLVFFPWAWKSKAFSRSGLTSLAVILVSGESSRGLGSPGLGSLRSGVTGGGRQKRRGYVCKGGLRGVSGRSGGRRNRQGGGRNRWSRRRPRHGPERTCFSPRCRQGWQGSRCRPSLRDSACL